MTRRKTAARKILEARNVTYGNAGLPGGFCDETTLLLMSQDAYERVRPKRPRSRMVSRKGSKRNG